MTNKEKKEMLEYMLHMSECYFRVYTSFIAKTGSIEQAYRLTQDMFSALFSQNRGKADSVSIFWDQKGESDKREG